MSFFYLFVPFYDFSSRCGIYHIESSDRLRSLHLWILSCLCRVWSSWSFCWIITWLLLFLQFFIILIPLFLPLGKLSLWTFRTLCSLQMGFSVGFSWFQYVLISHCFWSIDKVLSLEASLTSLKCHSWWLMQCWGQSWSHSDSYLREQA